MAKKMVQVAKLNVKEILGDRPLGLVNAQTKRKEVCRFTGIARKAQGKETAMGTSVKFQGDFMGWSIDNPDVIKRAAVAYFPPLFANQLEQQLIGAQNAHERAVNKGDVTNAEPPEITFGVKVFVKHDEKAATGYIYEFEPLIEMKQDDPAMRLLEAAGVKDVQTK